MVLSRLARAVYRGRPNMGRSRILPPNGSLKGSVAVPVYRGSFLDRDPFIHLMIYSAGVEVHVLPSRIPPSNIHGVLVGVLTYSSYDVKHPFLPMGSRLDSRQFGLQGRKGIPVSELARSSRLG
jgi:hypothetical protein